MLTFGLFFILYFVKEFHELTLIQGLAYPAQNSPPRQTAFHEIAGATVTEVRGAPRKVGLKKKNDQVEL